MDAPVSSDTGASIAAGLTLAQPDLILMGALIEELMVRYKSFEFEFINWC